jgi:adenylate cyclase class 1
VKNWLIKKFRKNSQDVVDTPIDPKPFIDRLSIYEQENKRRLETLKRKLTSRKLEVFELIPILLHEKHPELPGSDWAVNVPSGLACYDPSPNEITTLHKLFPTIEIEKRAKASRPIQFLCIMGSAGTASFTSESDIDFWVGIDKETLSQESISWLVAKLAAIEKWCFDTAQLVVHFFITDPEALRKEDYGEAQGESCGTALGKLLKDEFYRTALFICGKRPWYWIANIGAGEEEYQSMIAKLSGITNFQQSDYIDLGHVHKLDEDEFAGAALWHLSKALHSPFKSLLKLGHIDNLSNDTIRKPLCEKFKETLLSGSRNADPYFEFASEIRNEYESRNMLRESRLMETAYLIKSLSATTATETEKNELASSIKKLIMRWQIPEKEIDKIANFREWDFTSIEDLKKRIIQYLIGTYGRIQKKVAGNVNKISTRDTLVLGRKFRSFFESKPDKIPFEFIMHTLSEIENIRIAEQNGEWQILARIKGSKIADMALLSKFNNSAQALGYVFLNSLPFSNDAITFKGHIRFSKSEAAHLLDEMSQFFKQLSVDSENNENFMSPVVYKSAFIVPNWEQPDWNHGIASLSVYLWSSHAEFFILAYKGGDWKRWLFGEIFQNRIGKSVLKSCLFKVHKPEDRLGVRQKVSEDIEKEIETFISIFP